MNGFSREKWLVKTMIDYLADHEDASPLKEFLDSLDFEDLKTNEVLKAFDNVVYDARFPQFRYNFISEEDRIFLSGYFEKTASWLDIPKIMARLGG